MGAPHYCETPFWPELLFLATHKLFAHLLRDLLNEVSLFHSILRNPVFHKDVCLEALTPFESNIDSDSMASPKNNRICTVQMIQWCSDCCQNLNPLSATKHLHDRRNFFTKLLHEWFWFGLSQTCQLQCIIEVYVELKTRTS